MSKVSVKAYCRTPGKRELSMWSAGKMAIEHEGTVEGLINDVMLVAEQDWKGFKGPVLLLLEDLGTAPLVDQLEPSEPEKA
jgi:hypothetical protein